MREHSVEAAFVSPAHGWVARVDGVALHDDRGEVFQFGSEAQAVKAGEARKTQLELDWATPHVGDCVAIRYGPMSGDGYVYGVIEEVEADGKTFSARYGTYSVATGLTLNEGGVFKRSPPNAPTT